ncbi:MAG TPA: STAS domain-containing protein [Phycisphaerae bacterium]|jgi:anti-anti-sigma factor|nr:STAS domain-containing protein [Phycisphaerae bacterium]HOB76180.1 STAS domain-containing protein [Phycisphaerae bacterium]HOJ54581.1 STAS domain-containing protein [Phycisphaerae bacterium]HOL27026.1 STAS domain-containing protein [Phycisphaerae bacterium]HPP22822.1 STAS domain-containing protein [Phycisphaerae bacterium]
MAIQNWSENVLLVELSDDPQFTDDLDALLKIVQSDAGKDVVLSFQNVGFLNSSNIAKLLKLRKIQVVNNHRKLKLCAINTHVWGVFLITGLDKIFEVYDDVATGLASLQMP